MEQFFHLTGQIEQGFWDIQKRNYVPKLWDGGGNSYFLSAPQ